MADGVSNDGNGDEPLVLANPVGRVDAQSFDDLMDEEVETLERKQKILAKIICVPGTKTYIASIMKQLFSIIQEIVSQATFTADSGLTIGSSKTFPTGKTFSDAFKPIQSADTNSVKMVFHMTTAPTFKSIKRGNVKLLDFLKREANVFR